MHNRLTNIPAKAQHHTVAAKSATRRENLANRTAQRAAGRFFCAPLRHARLYGGRVGQLRAGRYPFEPVSHPCTLAALSPRARAAVPSYRGTQNMSAVAPTNTVSPQHVSSALNDLLAQAQAILSLLDHRVADLPQHTFRTALSAAMDVIGEAQALLIYVFDGPFSTETLTAFNDRISKAKSIIYLLMNADLPEEDTAELACSAAFKFITQAMESLESEVN